MAYSMGAKVDVLPGPSAVTTACTSCGSRNHCVFYYLLNLVMAWSAQWRCRVCTRPTANLHFLDFSPALRLHVAGTLVHSYRPQFTRLILVVCVSLMERLPRLNMVTVLFEAPHRLELTLDFLDVSLPDQTPIVVCREMTKVHQQVYKGTPLQIAQMVGGCK